MPSLELKAIAGLVVAVLLALGAWFLVHRGEQIADAKAAAATVAQQKEDATISAHRVQNLTEALNDTKLRADASRAAADSADRALAAERMQRSAYIRAHSRPADPGASSAGASTDASLDLFSELLDGRDDVIRQLAQALDASYAAGLVCERAYPVTP